MNSTEAPVLPTIEPRALPVDLLARFDRPGPRYTSYPTADRFADGFDAAVARDAWRRRDAATAGPLAVYVHIPFCESLCYYCACNKVVTRKHDRAPRYIDALKAELAMTRATMRPGTTVSQLHFGGGTPTFLDDDQLADLADTLRATFAFRADPEMSIEVDPRTVDARRLARLRRIGFDRISFGVQDFDTDVQAAIHRIQPFDDVRALVDAARREAYASVNVDLIYGLPRQTSSTFERTIRSTIALRPDRIALYAYAHLPQRFKAQRRIADHALPDPACRVGLLGHAIDAFIDHGYDYIGMDHFALPTDALARARREGRLHRDFQGYGTQPDGDLLGLGASAISRVGDVYSQNVKDPGHYEAAIGRGAWPVDRGVALSADDLLRRAVIMGLMCNGRLDFADIDARFAVDCRQHFADELGELATFAADGLVRLEPDGVRVTTSGWFLVRAVAMVFDRRLRMSHGSDRFSRVV